MRISVFGVGREELMMQCSGECDKEALNRLFDARGVSLCKGVEERSSTFGTVAAISRATVAVSSNTVLPVWSEEDGFGR